MRNDAQAAADTRRGIAAFLAISFGLAWVGFIPELFGGTAIPVLVPIAPAIAAVVVRKWVTREGFARLRLAPEPSRMAVLSAGGLLADRRHCAERAHRGRHAGYAGRLLSAMGCGAP